MKKLLASMILLTTPAFVHAEGAVISTKTERFCTFIKKPPSPFAMGSLNLPLGDFPPELSWLRVTITETTTVYEGGREAKVVEGMESFPRTQPTQEEWDSCLTKEEFNTRYEDYYRRLAAELPVTKF